MAKRAKNNLDLFEVVEREDEKEQAEKGLCQHKFETKTETDWPNFPNDPRMTWTCETCSRIRGRCP